MGPGRPGESGSVRALLGRLAHGMAHAGRNSGSFPVGIRTMAGSGEQRLQCGDDPIHVTADVPAQPLLCSRLRLMVYNTDAILVELIQNLADLRICVVLALYGPERLDQLTHCHSFDICLGPFPDVPFGCDEDNSAAPEVALQVLARLHLDGLAGLLKALSPVGPVKLLIN